jgi:protoheme IX farnesyltransferase
MQTLFKSDHPRSVTLHPWLQLIKIPLCMLVACSAGFGFILHTPELTPSLGATLFGVFALACGAAGFNSLQEVSADYLLLRTAKRPLVTGRLSKREAISFSLVLVFLGCLCLFLSADDWHPLWLGITALVFYNGIYTPLKSITVFALFPGGIAGALPPLIGWDVAGGLLTDSRAMVLLSLFFLWQIPHFCLILLSHQEDYRAVQQPTLIRLLAEQSLKRITMVWMLSFTTVALSLTLYRDMLHTGARIAITLMAGVVISLCIPLFFTTNTSTYRRLLFIFNGSFFSTMLAVAFLQLHALW